MKKEEVGADQGLILAQMYGKINAVNRQSTGRSNSSTYIHNYVGYLIIISPLHPPLNASLFELHRSQ